MRLAVPEAIVFFGLETNKGGPPAKLGFWGNYPTSTYCQPPYRITPLYYIIYIEAEIIKQPIAKTDNFIYIFDFIHFLKRFANTVLALEKARLMGHFEWSIMIEKLLDINTNIRNSVATCDSQG